MANIQFSYFSIATLTAALLMLVLGCYFIFKTQKSLTSFLLAGFFIPQAIVYSFWFSAYSVLSKSTSLYEHVSIVSGYISLTCLLQFAYHFPKNVHKWESKFILAASVISFSSMFLFLNNNIFGKPIMYFENHMYVYYAKYMAIHYALVSCTILWLMLLFVRKAYLLSDDMGNPLPFKAGSFNIFSFDLFKYPLFMTGLFFQRVTNAKNNHSKAHRSFFLLFFFGAMFAIFSRIANESLVSFFMSPAINCTIALLFSLFFAVSYINHSGEKISFMPKLAGITFIFIMIVIANIAFITLDEREQSYDEIRLAEVNNIRADITNGWPLRTNSHIVYILSSPIPNEPFDSLWLNLANNATIHYTRDDRFHINHIKDSILLLENHKGKYFSVDEQKRFIKHENIYLENLKKNNIKNRTINNYHGFFAEVGNRYIHFDFIHNNQIYQVGYSYFEYRAYMHESVRKLVLLAFICAILLLIIFPMFFLSNFTRPLGILLKGVKEINEGNLETRVPVTYKDEIGELTYSFNQMANSIQQKTSHLKEKNDRLLLSQKKIKENEEKYRTILENIIEGYFETNIDGEFTFFNTPLCNILGETREELMGADSRDYMTKETRKKIFALLKHLNRYDTVERTTDCEIINKKGAILICDFTSTAIREASGRVIGYKSMVYDMTERIQTERELFKSSKIESIGVFAGGLAHDFNNLLTAIMGNISIAKFKLDETHLAFKVLDKAEKACLRARDLTGQLLTFAKGGEPIKKAASIGDLLIEASNFALSGSDKKPEFKIPKGLWNVEIDEGQISQVIHNIVLNAREAVPKESTIYIQAENFAIDDTNTLSMKSGKYIVISIEDHGIGMTNEELENIFDPFFSTKDDGSGLGLSVSFSIIQKHNGYIRVKSRKGSGTRFKIYLPSSDKNIPGDAHDMALPHAAGKGRILLMDDKEMILSVGTEMLTSMGFEVECAESGEAAIGIYKKAIEEGNPFDCVILDLTIPGKMGGEKANKVLKQMDPCLISIVSSGYSNNPVMANYQDYGFTDVVVKPYKMEDLKKVLFNSLQKKVLKESGR